MIIYVDWFIHIDMNSTNYSTTFNIKYYAYEEKIVDRLFSLFEKHAGSYSTISYSRVRKKDGYNEIDIALHSNNFNLFNTLSTNINFIKIAYMVDQFLSMKPTYLGSREYIKAA